LNEYIKRWTLSADSLLTRNPHPNAPVLFNPEDPFHFSRGLPSCAQGVANMKMGVDLLAALYRANLSYASILQLSGKQSLAQSYIKRDKTYQEFMKTGGYLKTLFFTLTIPMTGNLV
jgi:hypothetical protein